MLSLTTGTAFIMWLGEQITERGIGNGMSLIIFCGIVVNLPNAINEIVVKIQTGDWNFLQVLIILIMMVAVVGFIVLVERGERRIPVQYAKQVVGNKLYGGKRDFIPLKLNSAGVMPIIFAQAILMVPEKVLGWLGSSVPSLAFLGRLSAHLREGAFLYVLLFGLMILFFSYFWVATQFNEIQIADDLKKHGGYIPGIRPGQATSQYLHNAMSRITFAGAIFLTLIATIPILLNREMQVPFQVATFFGGTSMLILVGVMLDTMRQMESHLLMRHYDGFLKKGKLRGRF